jgi:hypothetical protein
MKLKSQSSIIRERESVDRSQMDIKRKTCNNPNWKEYLLLDTSSIDIDTLVPSLYHCFETRGMEVFRMLSQPLPNLVGHYQRTSYLLDRISRPSLILIYFTTTFHRKQETFFYEYPLHCVLWATKKKRNAECCSSVVHTSSSI